MRTRFAITAAAAATALLTLPGLAGAKVTDRNQDGIPDSWEKKHKLALVTGQEARDQDKDGLSNLAEWQARTNPRRRDSDRDGTPDGREDGDRDGLRNRFEEPTGHDAGEPDTDDDGVKDGKEGAGRVTSLAGGVLTVDLGAGRKARGKLTDDTFTRCGVADDWLLGVFEIPSEDGTDPADETDPAEDVVELLDDLLPAARVAEDEEVDEAPSGDEPSPDVPDEPGTDESDEPDAPDEETLCPAGAIRKGTWLHSSIVDAGAFAWLDVVTKD